MRFALEISSLAIGEELATDWLSSQFVWLVDFSISRGDSEVMSSHHKANLSLVTTPRADAYRIAIATPIPKPAKKDFMIHSFSK